MESVERSLGLGRRMARVSGKLLLPWHGPVLCIRGAAECACAVATLCEVEALGHPPYKVAVKRCSSLPERQPTDIDYLTASESDRWLVIDLHMKAHLTPVSRVPHILHRARAICRIRWPTAMDCRRFEAAIEGCFESARGLCFEPSELILGE